MVKLQKKEEVQALQEIGGETPAEGSQAAAGQQGDIHTHTQRAHTFNQASSVKLASAELTVATPHL